MNLYKPQTHPFENVDKVGIAVTASKSTSGYQFHIAILFRDNDGVKLFHLPSNHVCVINPKPKYLWLELGHEFSDIDKTILQAHIRKIIDANGITFGVAYGFDVDGKFFDPETGRFSPHSDYLGMTCSTFILEVFASCGYKLIDIDSWPAPTKVDKKWQEAILNLFHTQGLMTTEIFNSQLKNVGNKRFLPQEVAASTQFDIPVLRGTLMAASNSVSQSVKQHVKSFE